MRHFQSITRRAMLAGTAAAATFSILPSRAGAAEFEYKMGHSSPDTDPFHQRLLQVADRIEKETGGRMRLAIFPNSQLGGDNDLLSQCRSGAVEFCQPAGLILASILPVTAIDGMGFAWKDYSQIWPAMDGQLGQYVRSKILENTNLIPMEHMWDLGFRQIANSLRPVQTVADLAGMKVRVPGAPALVSLFQALGASPVSMQFGEVYTSMQTKIVDAVEDPLTHMDFAKFYEVAKYLSVTNHVWDGYWICCNSDAWKRLPSDIQGVVATAFNETSLLHRQDVQARDKTLQATLEAKGMVFNHADTETFRKKLTEAGFYKQWREKIGQEAWSLLEKYAGKLG